MLRAVTFVALLGAVACKSDGKSPATSSGSSPVPVLPGTRIPGASGAGCARDLADFLTALAADGPTDPPTVKLVPLARPPTRVPEALHVTVMTDADDPHPGRLPMLGTPEPGAGPLVEVAAAGRLFGVGTSPDEAAREIVADLKQAASSATPVVFDVGGEVPWRFVTALAGAAVTDAGLTSVRFGFVATGPGSAKRPPASSIDAKIPEREGRIVKTLEERFAEPFPPLAVEIFERCAEAREALRTAFDADDRAAAVVELLPPAVGACGCQVELPAVKRLYWELWGREEGSLQTTVEVALAVGGTLVRADPGTPWRDAHAALVTAASQGKPIELR